MGAWFTEGDCIDPGEPAASCIREHAFSIAIPRDRWGRQGGTVKPGDLTLDVVISGPDANGKPSTILSSSAATTAFVPFGRGDLAGYLAPGESLTVTRQLSGSTQELFVLGRDASPKPPGFQTFGALVLSLFGMDLADPVAVSEQRRSFGVRGGSFDMIYRSSPRGLDAELLSSGAAVAAYAVPMIVLAVLAWVTIDRGVLRRVMRLTGRTRLVSLAIRANGNLNQFDFSALKGRDELGVLATGLDDLLKRIADDVQRNAIRLHHERSMLRAIGHEIRAPLQSLSAVLATSEAGTGYVRRMLKAVAALYGSDSPSDGFESAEMESERMDLADFLVKVAANAHHAGINNVEYRGPRSGVHIRADQAALEDAISHILRNAKRYRPESTPITISLTHGPTTATASIYNAGPPIPEDLLDRIFDYGVSENKDAADGSEGQGLFVAATYLAKMGGTIAAKNLPVGVEFAIQLPVLAPK